MDEQQSEHYKGFLISGCAELDCGRWRSMVILQRDNCDSEGIPVSPLCDSAAQAIEQAMQAARSMVDSKGFALHSVADPDVMGADGHRVSALDPACAEITDTDGPSGEVFTEAALPR